MSDTGFVHLIREESERWGSVSQMRHWSASEMGHRTLLVPLIMPTILRTALCVDLFYSLEGGCRFVKTSLLC